MFRYIYIAYRILVLKKQHIFANMKVHYLYSTNLVGVLLVLACLGLLLYNWCLLLVDISKLFVCVFAQGRSLRLNLQL